MFSAPVTVVWTAKARDVAIAEQEGVASIKVPAVAAEQRLFWPAGWLDFIHKTVKNYLRVSILISV